MIISTPQCIVHDYPYSLHSLSFIILLIAQFISCSQSCFLLSTCTRSRGKLEGSAVWCSIIWPTALCSWAGEQSFSSQGCLFILVQSAASTEFPDDILHCWQKEVETLFQEKQSVNQSTNQTNKQTNTYMLFFVSLFLFRGHDGILFVYLVNMHLFRSCRSAIYIHIFYYAHLFFFLLLE